MRTGLFSYRNLLVQWQQQYAPRTPDEETHPRFMEAIRKLEMVEYDLDLLQGGIEVRTAMRTCPVRYRTMPYVARHS